VSVWQSTHSRIVVALLEMMSSEFIYASLGGDRNSYACGDLLNFLINFIIYLSSQLLAYYPVLVSMCGFTLILQVLA
jgi:hypothetical protein